MSNSTLMIPKKIRVGFQERNDTYTGKLAYIIYYDQKGKLRKETSWNSWRDKKIEPVEYNNEPVEGFVLNRKVGGYKSDWNHRATYSRIYDPRGFEFEIDIPNLLFILQECDCNKGKGLEGKFVYAWDGTSLILLPANSQSCQDSQKHTELQAKKVGIKELVVGHSYLAKDQRVLTYVGKLDYYYAISSSYWREPKNYKNGVSKRHVFVDLNKLYKVTNPDEEDVVTNEIIFHYDQQKNLAEKHSDVEPENFAEILSAYYQGPHGSKYLELFLKENPDEKPKNVDIANHTSPENLFYALNKNNNTFYRYDAKFDNDKMIHLTRLNSVFINGDGKLQSNSSQNYHGDGVWSKYQYSNHYEYNYFSIYTYTHSRKNNKYINVDPPQVQYLSADLYVKTENNPELKFDKHNFDYEKD